MQEVRGAVYREVTDAFHAFTQQNVASRSENDYEKNQGVGLEMEFGK